MGEGNTKQPQGNAPADFSQKCQECMTDRSPMPLDSQRPAVAIVSNSQTPYRLALHRRIAAEIPRIKLWSLYTHEISNSTWPFEAPPEINPVLFGKGERSGDQDRLTGIWREWRRGGRIIRWMQQHNIRFVVMMGYNDAGRMRMIRWCRKRGIPCYLFGDSNIHGDTATGIKALIKKWVVGRVVRSCTGILTCGTLGQAYFAKYGANPDRMFFFPYEPDYQLLRNLPDSVITQARHRFGLAEGRRRLVYSGRLTAVKRVDLLLAAFIRIAPQRPDWDLVVIGDGPLAADLRAAIPPNLAQRVIWTGFLDDQALISGIYRACDALVLPSDYEPWALVINEAAAAGLAVVSSNVVGAAAELVSDDVNGKLFKPGDLPGLIQSMLEVTDPANIDRMKTASTAVLADWQQRGDPVAGLRRALQASAITVFP